MSPQQVEEVRATQEQQKLEKQVYMYVIIYGMGREGKRLWHD